MNLVAPIREPTMILPTQTTLRTTTARARTMSDRFQATIFSANASPCRSTPATVPITVPKVRQDDPSVALAATPKISTTEKTALASAA